MNCYEDNNTIRFDEFGDAPIYIGKVGENLVTSLDIDLTGALPEDWTVGLLLRRPGETAVYPKVGEMRGNVYHVDFALADTAKHGEGQATLVLYGENGEVKKTFLARTKVTYTLSANGAAPDPITEWTTAANEKLAEIDAALDELNFHPVEKTEEMTQPVGKDEDGKFWTAPGGTGDHTELINRDVADQHPISAITGLQSALDTKGTYNKPTDGIPASDLTQSAQASLGKADSAVQPSAIADMATKTWVGEQDYITEEEAPVQDVTINGVSIVEQQIAKIVYETGLGADSSNAATVTAIRAFVNSSINSVAAYYITADALGGAFASKAALEVGPYYYAGSLRTPTKNDYAIVMADENHSGNTARYVYTDNQWAFQYTFNMSFTAAQLAALNSGITAAKVALYDEHIASTANPHNVTKSQVGLGNVADERQYSASYPPPADTAKADKVTGAVSGNFAGLDSNGNLTDSGKQASDFATAAQGVSDTEKTAWNGKQDKITASGVLQGDGNGGVTEKTVDSTPTAGSSNLVTSGGVEAAKENKQPHPYDYDGVDLKALFGSANALHTALAAGDYSHIHNGDYYPVTFSGSYRDYGEWVALAGTKYYSDTACTVEAGTLTEDKVVTHVDASPAYHDITIDGTTYHCKMQDLQRYREKTINASVKMEANINPYWRYGDSGILTGGKPHICWIARDGITTAKMRSTNQQWDDAVEEFYTGDGSTTVFKTDDATLKCVKYVCVNGTLQTYNTAYTVDTATGKVTFKSGYIPAAGADIIISRTTHDNPWTGSAIFRTLNDPDYGLMRLITDTEFAAHILDNMRYYGETRTVANNASVAVFNRGKGFLPTEPEVWGECVYSIRGNYSFLPQLPVFAPGARRHISKGSSNGGSRASWWVASSYSTTAFCYATSNSIANGGAARIASAIVPGFITT